MSFALAAGFEPISGYRCVRRLGRTGHGETWLMQTEDETYRTLKWLYDGASLRHARKLTSYRHPFLFNWERTEAQASDLLLISDWAEETLDVICAEHISQKQMHIPHETLLRYLQELAEALDYLHIKHKIMHGRLKVSQVGIQHHHAKLLDWGLYTSEKLASASWTLETLQTSAPEALAGQLEPASDQFSLAALYLQASHNQFPLPAVTLTEFFQARTTSTFDARNVPIQFHSVLQRALHKDPAARFPTCAAFIKALQTAENETQPSNVTPTEHTAEAEQIWAEKPLPLQESATPPAIPTVMIKSLVAMETGTSSKHPDSAFLNLNNLAYHSKVQSFGILTPTLIMGVGKQGEAVLQELSHLLHQRYDGAHNLPHIRLLAIDTRDGQTDLSSLTKPGDLLPDQLLNCPLSTPASWQNARNNSNIAHWLPMEQLPEPTSDKLENAPSLARLSLVNQYQTLRLRLQQECRIMMQSESLMRSKQHTGLSIRQDLVPTCYLVGSLDELFTVGCLADLAYVIRSVISEAGWGVGQLTGILFLPSRTAPEQIKARSYASLTELHHYTQENYFSAHYGDSNELNYPQPPFEYVFFHQNQSEISSAPIMDQTRQVANWLLRDVASELGSLRLASREATDSFASRTTSWYGHGISLLQSSLEPVQHILKKRLLGNLIGHWLGPDEDVQNAIRGDGERFLDQYIHSASSLLERFQHMTAVMLGREPAHLIDEWIAPLRKGAAARPSLESLAHEIMNKVETTFGTSGGYQNSPTLSAIQQEAESVAMDIASKIEPFLMQYLDKPGLRLGASLQLGKLLLHWVTHQLSELQASHMEIHQDMLRAERTITQMMTQEERSFAIMGRQRLVSQIVSDLSDYPSRVLKEDMFARAVYVFQVVKNAIESVLSHLEPAELTLRELQQQYNMPTTAISKSLLLDGEATLDERVEQILLQMPDDVYIRLDNDLNEALVRFQSNYQDVCLGKGPSFSDILDLLDNAIDECMEGMLPSEDAAEQLLTQPSQAVVEQLRQCYRNARPDLMENKRSRQGAFCLMLTSNSEQGQELLQMAQATLPQIVAAPEGLIGEILFYRETGCLMPQEIYPEGQAAYQTLVHQEPALLHSRFDIAYWHSIASSSDAAFNSARSISDSSMTVSV